MSPGGANDLEMATELAGKIEMTFGLGALGLLSLGNRPVVDAMMLMPDLREAVRRRLDVSYRRAIELIEADRETLEACVEAFLPRRYLTASRSARSSAATTGRSASRPGRRASPIPVPGTGRRDDEPRSRRRSAAHVASIANDESLSLDDALAALSAELGVPPDEVSDHLARLVRRRAAFERLKRMGRNRARPMHARARRRPLRPGRHGPRQPDGGLRCASGSYPTSIWSSPPGGRRLACGAKPTSSCSRATSIIR